MFHIDVDAETELRVPELRDAAALFALIKHNRTHLGQFIPEMLRIETVEIVEQGIRAQRERFAEGEGPSFAIWHRGEHVGNVGLRVHSSGVAELGYWLAQAHTGKGLVTRAAQVAVAYGFSQMGLRRIFARCALANERSRAVVERLDFTHEGVQRQAFGGYEDGHYDDLHVYSLLADEWHGQPVYLSCRVDDEVEIRYPEANYATLLSRLIQANREHLEPFMTWMNGGYNPDADSAAASLNRFRQQIMEDEVIGGSLWYRGEIAGRVNVFDIDTADRKAEIGYWQGEAFTGKGIMTRACRALLDYSFDTLNLNRITLQAATDNHRSRAIAERLGFTLEGIEREGIYHPRGYYMDMAVYSLLAREWRAANGR